MLGVEGGQRDSGLPDFKLFFIYIYKCHGPALVNKGSFGDTQWWSSLRGIKLVDMLALRL